ncbi:MAG: TetR/AcrR family transcriptional regulator [Mangrovibacterium sp.]
MATKRQVRTIEIKEEMLDTVRRMLIKHGFYYLNVKTFGEESKVDVSALYRHFGGFQELLDTYLARQDFWLNSLRKEDATEADNPIDFLKEIIRDQFELVWKNEDFQQILVWELADKVNDTLALTVKREMFSRKLLAQGEDMLSAQGIKFNYIIALIFAGFYFLICHKHRGDFCTVDLSSPENKEELLCTIFWLVDVIFEKVEQTNALQQVAIQAHQEGLSSELIAKITKLSMEEVERLKR